MTDPNEIPPHYRSTIALWIKLGLVGISVGMILGIWWTNYRKKIIYGTPAQIVEGEVKKEYPKAEIQLPGGMNFEAGLKFKLSHGHAILILGLIPMCFAASIHLTRIYGNGRVMGAGAMKAGFWLYAVGGIGAVAIIVYRGYASYLEILQVLDHHDTFDDSVLQHIQDRLFGGSRAIKGAAYGITHTVLAVGAGIVVYQVWRALGKAPATVSPAEPEAPAEPAASAEPTEPAEPTA